jgi:hypothetical protein
MFFAPLISSDFSGEEGNLQRIGGVPAFNGMEKARSVVT